MNNNNVVVTLIGKSGTGKSSIESTLCTCFSFYPVISHTSRKPRLHEINGKDYHFDSTDKFQQMIANNELLEHNIIYDNFYGVAKKDIDLSNHDYVCSVDYSGFLNLQKTFGNKVIPIYIYIEEYERLIRLLKREKNVESAMYRFNKNNDTLSKDSFEYTVKNDDPFVAAQEISSIVKTKKMKFNYD